MRKVISSVTAVTQFLDTAVTNCHNTTVLANTSLVTSFDEASNPIPATKPAHQELVLKELEGTRIITAGVTVYAFL